ncbi:hypothetical protein D3C80_1647490 [compost metagenome]
MKWCQIEQTANFGFNLACYKCGALEDLAPVNHAVSNSLDFFNRIKNAAFLINQLVEHLADRSSMFQNFTDLGNFLFTGWFMCKD